MGRNKKPLATGPQGEVPVGKVLQTFANRTYMAIAAKDRIEDEMKAWRLIATYAALQAGGTISISMQELAELDEAVDGSESTIGAELFMGTEDKPTVLRVVRK